MFTVRPVHPEDRAAVAALWSQTLGEPITAETLAGWEALHVAGERRLRLVAESDGHVVGAIAVVRHEDESDAYLRLFVDRDHRARGIGSALLERAMAFAHEAGALAVRTTTDDDASTEFAHRRQFTATSRTIESWLTVGRWRERALPAIGDVSIESLHPDDDEAFHSAAVALGREAGEMLGRSDFDARVLGHGDDRCLQYIARHDRRIVGVLCTERVPGTMRAIHCLTAVDVKYRGRHIARALKVHAIRAARAAELTHLVASNDATNAAMLAVNAWAGFSPLRKRAELVASLA